MSSRPGAPQKVPPGAREAPRQTAPESPGAAGSTTQDTTVEHYTAHRRPPLARLALAVRRLASPRRLAATCRYAAEVAGAIRRRRAEPRLTVAVDVHALYETPTGVGWYLVRLLESLAGRDDLRLRLYAHGLVDSPETPRPAVAIPAGPAIERVAYKPPDGLVVPPWRANQILRRLSPLLAAADGNRVLFAPNYLVPRLFRLARGARVATVHDLAIRQVPWAVRPDSGAALVRGLARTLLEADLILTPSEAVRAELAAERVDPRRVRAIHHGPGHSPRHGPGHGPRTGAARAAALPIGTPERFVLHVGTLEPRKNVPLLLAAWRHLLEAGRQPSEAGAGSPPATPVPPLVLAGGFGWRADALRRQVARAAAEGWLVHLGYVAPEGLTALYARATAAVLPSFYEGFGLPLLEALAAGLPVVASDIPVHREVAGEAALYAPPDRPDLFAARLAEILGDAGLRERLAVAARARSALFSWERAADEAARAFADAALGR